MGACISAFRTRTVLPGVRLYRILRSASGALCPMAAFIMIRCVKVVVLLVLFFAAFAAFMPVSGVITDVAGSPVVVTRFRYRQAAACTWLTYCLVGMLALITAIFAFASAFYPSVGFFDFIITYIAIETACGVVFRLIIQATFNRMGTIRLAFFAFSCTGVPFVFFSIFHTAPFTYKSSTAYFVGIPMGFFIPGRIITAGIFA